MLFFFVPLVPKWGLGYQGFFLCDQDVWALFCVWVSGTQIWSQAKSLVSNPIYSSRPWDQIVHKKNSAPKPGLPPISLCNLQKHYFSSQNLISEPQMKNVSCHLNKIARLLLVRYGINEKNRAKHLTVVFCPPFPFFFFLPRILNKY